MQSLKETGFDEEDGTQVNMVSRALAEVGIKLVDAQGNFRNFGIVMDELGAKWSTLSNRQQAYLATTVAGSYQQSRFLNLMSGYSDSIDLYKGALDSAGISQKKFAIYEESNAAAIARLKNAWSGLWQSSFNSDTIVNITNALTALVTVFDKLVSTVGILPVMFAGFATAAALLSKNFRTLTISVLTLGNGFKGLGVSATVAKTAIRGLLASTVVGAVFAGLGFALEKIINLLFGTKKAQEDYSQSMKDLVSTTDESISQLVELNTQYQNSVGTQEELNNLKKQMAEIMPEIVDHYDAEGNAVYKTTQEIEKLIEQEKKLNLARKQNLLDTMSDRLSPQAKEIDNTRDNISDLDGDRFNAKARYEALQFSEQYINDNDLMNLDKRSDEYLEKIQHLQNEIKRIFLENNSYASDTFLFSELLDNNGDISKAVENARVEFGNINTIIDDSKEHISETAKAFSDEFKSTVNTLVLSANDIDDKNATALLDNIAESFVQTKEITKENSADIINEYQTFAASLGKFLSTNKIDVTQLIESGNFDVLRKALTDSGLSAEIADKVLSAYSSTLQDVVDIQADLASRANAISTAFKTNAEEVKYLNGVISDLSDNQSISAEVMSELIQKYPSLAEGAYKTAEGWRVEEAALVKLRDGHIDLGVTALEEEQKNTLTTLNNALARIKLYGLETQSIQTLADAKKAYNELDALKVDIPTANPTNQEEAMKFITGLDQNKNISEVQTYIDEFVNLTNEAEKLKETLKDPSFGVPSSKKDKTKKGPDDTPEIIDATEGFINAANKLAEERHKLNESIDKQADKLSDDGKFDEAIKKRTMLLESQRKEIKLLTDANKTLSNKRKAIDDSTDYNLSSFVDANGEATQSFYDLYNSLGSKKAQEELQTLFDKYQKYTKAILANYQAVKDISNAREQTQKDLEEDRLENTTKFLEKIAKSREKYDEQLEQSEKVQSRYKEGSTEYVAEELKQIKIMDEKRKALHDENEWIRKRLEANTQAKDSEKLTAEQVAVLTQKLKENSDAWFEVDDAQRQAIETLRNSYLEQVKDSISSVIETLRSSIDREDVFDIDSFNDSIATIQDALSELDGNFRSFSFDFRDSFNDVSDGLEAFSEDIADISEKVHSFVESSADSVDELGDQINAQIAYISELKGKLEEINNLISDRERQYKAEENALENTIKLVEESYDAQINAQQEKLDLLDEEYEKEDRIKKLREINDELDKTKADKRFSFITETGEEILTYDKARVDELEKQKDELVEQYRREDVKKAIEDEIDRLEKAKDAQVAILQDQLTQMRAIHEQDLEALRVYQSGLSQLLAGLEADTKDKLSKYADTLITGLENGTIAAQEGTAALQSVIDNWMNTSLSGWDTYNTSLAQKMTTMQSLLSKMQELASIGASIGSTTTTTTTTTKTNTATAVKKYHTGGQVGNEPLKPNEVPAILERGEWVLKPEQIETFKASFISPVAQILGKIKNAGSNAISSIINKTSNVTSPSVTYDFSGMTVQANNPMEFFADIKTHVASIRK